MQDDTDYDQAWSVLQITRKGPGDSDLPDRSVWFDRTDLRMVRQRIYDAQGLIVSDTKYDKWQTFGGVVFPSHLEASFKKAGYGLAMDVTDMKMNLEIIDKRFEMEQPAGSKLQVLGGSDH